MPKIILKGHIIVPELDLVAVQKELKVHSQLTKQEPGCLIFDVSQDKCHLNKFNVYEEFINQSAFDSHQLRVKSSNWGKLTQGVKRYYQVTEVE